MAFYTYSGYRLTDLVGGSDPSVSTGQTFNVSGVSQIDIIFSDDDAVIDENGTNGSAARNSQDSLSNQIAYVRTDAGAIQMDGAEFFVEALFTYTVDGKQYFGVYFEAEGQNAFDFVILDPATPPGAATVCHTFSDLASLGVRLTYDDIPSGDEVFNAANFANLITTGNDTITAGDGDDTISSGAGNDTIFAGNGDDSVFAGGGADTVFGGGGDDTLRGEGGADTIEGGAGSDIIQGGAGNDVLRGGGTLDAERTSFGTLPDPSGNGTLVDDGDTYTTAGFTQDTGSVQVSLSFQNDGNNAPSYTFRNSDAQYTTGLNGGAGASDNAIRLGGTGDGDTSTTTIAFRDDGVATDVTGVNFRINDIDVGNFRDTLRIQAFDAEGNPVQITLTGGSNMTLTDTDGVAGNDTATANAGGAGLTSADAAGSLLVEVAGPVSTITIDYGNLAANLQYIWVTDIFFTPTDAGDTIDGGAGNDTIDGDAGDDTIAISTGSDTIDGGTGQDTYDATNTTTLTNERILVTVASDGSATVQKVNSGTTDTTESVETFIATEVSGQNDRITFTETDLRREDVSGIDDTATGTFTDIRGNVVTFGPGETWQFSDVIGGNIPNVSRFGDFAIDGGDENGTINGTTYQNFEEVSFTVVCFADGTLIETPEGPRPIEALAEGDLVHTLDHGPRPIRWAGRRHLGAAVLAAHPRLRPIRIAAGALGGGLPERDLRVSPQHRILLRSRIAERMFGQTEVLVAAKRLLGLPGISVEEDCRGVTYHHILCDAHEVVFAEGALAETLLPGTEALNALAPEQRREVVSIFGERPVADTPRARLIPDPRRTKVLVDRHRKNARALLAG